MAVGRQRGIYLVSRPCAVPIGDKNGGRFDVGIVAAAALGVKTMGQGTAGEYITKKKHVF